MAYNENIKTFEAISKHLEMEDEHQKSLPFSNVAFVALDSKPECKRPFCGKQTKKALRAPQKSLHKNGVAKSQ